MNLELSVRFDALSSADRSISGDVEGPNYLGTAQTVTREVGTLANLQTGLVVLESSHCF